MIFRYFKHIKSPPDFYTKAITSLMSSIIKPLCAAGCGKDGILRCGRCLETAEATAKTKQEADDLQASDAALLRVSLLAALKRARVADEALSHLFLPRALRRAAAVFAPCLAACSLRLRPCLAACSLGGAAWLVYASCAIFALMFFAAGASTRSNAQAIVLGLTIISMVSIVRCAMSPLRECEYADAALADELRGAEALAAAAEARLAAATAADDVAATRDSESRAALSRYAYEVVMSGTARVMQSGACAHIGACSRSWLSVVHAAVALLFLVIIGTFSFFVVFLLAVPVAARVAFAACCCNATVRIGVDVLLLLVMMAYYYFLVICCGHLIHDTSVLEFLLAFID